MERSLDIAGLSPLDDAGLAKANGGWGPVVPIPPHVLIEILRNRQHRSQGLRPGYSQPLIPRQGAY